MQQHPWHVPLSQLKAQPPPKKKKKKKKRTSSKEKGVRTVPSVRFVLRIIILTYEDTFRHTDSNKSEKHSTGWSSMHNYNNLDAVPSSTPWRFDPIARSDQFQARRSSQRGLRWQTIGQDDSDRGDTEIREQTAVMMRRIGGRLKINLLVVVLHAFRHWLVPHACRVPIVAVLHLPHLLRSTKIQQARGDQMI